MAHGSVQARIARQREALMKRREKATLAMAQNRAMMDRALETVERERLAEQALHRRHAQAMAVADSAAAQLEAFFEGDDSGLDAEAAEVAAMAMEQARFDREAPLAAIPEVDEAAVDLDGFDSADPAFDDVLDLADAADFDAATIADEAQEVDVDGPAGFYNILREAHGGTDPKTMFADFKEVVFSASGEVGPALNVQEQHQLRMAQLESALEGVRPEDKGALQEQLTQYHLDEVMANPAIDPVLAMDILLGQCETVDQALMSEMQADVMQAGGADNFVKAQASAMAFYNSKMKGSAPAAEAEITASF